MNGIKPRAIYRAEFLFDNGWKVVYAKASETCFRYEARFQTEPKCYSGYMEGELPYPNHAAAVVTKAMEQRGEL